MEIQRPPCGVKPFFRHNGYAAPASGDLYRKRLDSFGNPQVQVWYGFSEKCFHENLEIKNALTYKLI